MERDHLHAKAMRTFKIFALGDGILDPRMFSERKLFIDPDIIGIVLDICFVFVSLVYHDEMHVCFYACQFSNSFQF